MTTSAEAMRSDQGANTTRSRVQEAILVDLRRDDAASHAADHQLHQAVLDELEWDPAVDPAHIGVAVNDGAVTLTGLVHSWPERLAALEAVKRVKGVHIIADELEARPPGGTGLTDTDIAVAAEHALAWNAKVPADGVSVTVRFGVLTLEGAVTWEYERRAAAEAVRSLKGVRELRNLLTLAPEPTLPDLGDRIEAALVRQAAEEAHRISVMVDGNDVHLRGRVLSWAERDAAEHAAWSAPGVARVHNHLRIGSQP